MRNRIIKTLAALLAAAAVLAGGALMLLKLRSMNQAVHNNVNESRRELLSKVEALSNSVNALEAQVRMGNEDLYQEVALDYDWIRDNPLVAHALGGVTLDGYVYDRTNSMEAFQENYDKGIRVFEADLMLSSDGALVCAHDWERYDADGPLTVTAFRQHSFYDGRLTQLTGEDLIDLLTAHPDIYIITDSKYTDTNSIRLEFSQLLYLAQEKQARQVLDRVIVQIYHQGMYDVIYDIYPWKSLIYTNYQTSDDLETIAAFCKERGIKVVTMTDGAASEENVAMLKENGITTYVHTVNEAEKVKKGQSIGIAGFYTDSLSPEEIK